VIGIFGDGQFGGLRGAIQDPIAGFTGRIKLEDSWAAGVRLGYLVAPNVLSYVNAGYSGSSWSGAELGLGVVPTPIRSPPTAGSAAAASITIWTFSASRRPAGS